MNVKHMSQAGINLDASATDCFNWSQNSQCQSSRQFFFPVRGKGSIGEALVLFLFLRCSSTDLSMTFSQLLMNSCVSNFAVSSCTWDHVGSALCAVCIDAFCRQGRNAEPLYGKTSGF